MHAPLAAIVLGHFLITLAHGAAHQGAHVALGPASMIFVVIVIEVAPLAGLVWSIWRRRAGARLVAASMGAALLFGVINHFLVISPDHVMHVEPAWRTSFGLTAALLAVTELAGAVVALRLTRAPAAMPSEGTVT
jgi:hypothetical protein